MRAHQDGTRHGPYAIAAAIAAWNGRAISLAPLMWMWAYGAARNLPHGT